VATQIRAIDFTAQKARSFEPLDVYRHGGLRHAEDAGQFRGVRVRVYLGWGSSVEESRQIIDRFIELGGNFIDTANSYTKGHSEKIIGDHVGRHSARRDRLVIATKFSGNLYPGDPNGGGSGRKSIIAACENSLRRLQTDYIDLYWLHHWDVNTPIEETMAALEDLVRAGKVRYLGVSDTPAWKVAEANVTARFRGWRVCRTADRILAA
jgi:aryl-alcohol dehydrogenase-like predicted oxidoreductase